MVADSLTKRGPWGEILLPAERDSWEYLLQAARGDGGVGDEAVLAVRQALRDGDLLRLPDGTGPQDQLGFAPVLQYLGGMAWRIGVPRQGRLEFIVAAGPEDAVAQAQELYRRLCMETQ